MVIGDTFRLINHNLLPSNSVVKSNTYRILTNNLKKKKEISLIGKASVLRKVKCSNHLFLTLYGY